MFGNFCMPISDQCGNGDKSGAICVDTIYIRDKSTCTSEKWIIVGMVQQNVVYAQYLALCPMESCLPSPATVNGVLADIIPCFILS